jgi:hypothetical protein
VAIRSCECHSQAERPDVEDRFPEASRLIRKDSMASGLTNTVRCVTRSTGNNPKDTQRRIVRVLTPSASAASQ